MKTATSKKTIYRRDTKTYDFVLKRDGTPINLTGYTPHFSARTEADGTILFAKTCNLTGATEGRCQVTLNSADTSTICKNAIAEVMIENGAGQQDTLGQFYIEIVKDIKTT